MTTKTDFDQLAELANEYCPAQRGILSPGEDALIRLRLEINSRTNIELQNIRNAAVAVYAQMHMSRYEAGCNPNDAMANMRAMDAVSAITGVIDQEKIKRGIPV